MYAYIQGLSSEGVKVSITVGFGSITNLVSGLFLAVGSSRTRVYGRTSVH
jgi:hypothetical protein